MLRLYFLLVISFAFVACGGGSSSKEDVPTKSLYLVDAPINGIPYKCGGYHGLTGFNTADGTPSKAGLFKCTDKKVIFSIGSLILAEIPAGSYTDNEKIYPQTIFNYSPSVNDTKKVLNFAQFIQSLDDDGDISESITINQAMRDKISALNIKDKIDWTDNNSSIQVLKQLNVPVKNMEDAKEHLILHTASPDIAPKFLEFDDNTQADTNIGTLEIINKEEITNILIVSPKEAIEQFYISKEGDIFLKKEANYTHRIEYNITVKAQSRWDTYGSLNIKVNSAVKELMNPIKTPIVLYANNDAIIYTNKPNYEVNIQARKDTNLFWDKQKVALMPSTGLFTLQRSITIKDTLQSHKIKLNYDNGKESPDTTIRVWYDDEAPVISTETDIPLAENIKLAKAIKAEDGLSSKGLTFSLGGGVDKELFKISATTGLLEFKAQVDYENRQDANQDNIYEVLVRISDKAGNASSKLFKVKVENQETNPTIANKTISVVDSKGINAYLGQISINTQDSTISSVELFNADKVFFNVTLDGKITLKKKLHYQTKRQHTFGIQVTNHRAKKSEVATVTVNVISSNANLMQNILAPTLLNSNSNSKIFTNTDTYAFDLQGRIGTNVYLDNQTEKIAVIPANGNLHLVQAIEGSDRSETHTISLGYDNGVKSEVSNFTVIKDTIAPKILTATFLEKEENVKLITNIEVDDANKEEGLTFVLENEKDAQHFSLTYDGELSFKKLPDFEEPRDTNQDNSYEVTIKVTDKAGNSSSINLTVKIVDILDSKPSIGTLNISADISQLVGSTLDRALINSGDSPISNLNLMGVGKEYFDIHLNGDIILIKKFNSLQTFYLDINATNQFGSTIQTIVITVTNNTNAKAQIEGGLAFATIKLIQLHSNNTQELIDISTTTSKGDFNLKKHLLNDEDFYIYEINGGRDTQTKIQNQGIIRLIAKGYSLKNASNKIIVSPLSEILYIYASKYITSNYSKLNSKLHEISQILLNKDLTENYIIDIQDILVFNPSYNKDALYPTLKINNSYSKIVNKIQENSLEYIKILFNAKVLKSFVDIENTKQSGSRSYVAELELSGSIAYYLQEDTFYIYNMYKDEIIGSILLEKQDLSLIGPITILSSESNAFDVKLTLDLKNQRIYIENLNQKIFILNVSDLKNPKLLGSFTTPFWSSYIHLIINNHIFLKSTNFLYRIFNVYDTNDPQNINVLNSTNIDFFTHITDNNTYNISSDNCNETNQLTITTYNFQDIFDKVSNKYLHYLITSNCYNNEFYFDNNYMYVYSSVNPSLKIYFLSKFSSEPILMNTFPYSVSKILNQNNNILHVYSKNYIYSIDTSNIYDLKIKQTIPYQYKYNSTEYFTGTDNLKINVQDDFIIESSRIIDLKSHLLSSIYTEAEEGIDYTLFKKYGQ